MPEYMSGASTAFLSAVEFDAEFSLPGKFGIAGLLLYGAI